MGGLLRESKIIMDSRKFYNNGCRLQREGRLPPIRQALFIDGGSAMKAYHVASDGEHARLDLLNRVAAGSRNVPGADPDGLNLYTLLALALPGDQDQPSPEPRGARS